MRRGEERKHTTSVGGSKGPAKNSNPVYTGERKVEVKSGFTWGGEVYTETERKGG